jgi:glutamate-1-semialdehyde 2,1-aminomutase
LTAPAHAGKVGQVASEASQIPRERLRTLREREVERFAELRPRGRRLLERAKASMPNGVPMTWMATL